MKKNLIRILAFVLGFGVIAVVLYAISFNDIQNLADGDEVLVEVIYSGGMCVDGSCYSSNSIYGNGVYTDHKRLTKDEVSELNKLINESDLDNLKMGPEYTYSCPSFADGADLSFVFPTKYGETQFKLCEIEDYESQPLLVYLEDLISTK